MFRDHTGTTPAAHLAEVRQVRPTWLTKSARRPPSSFPGREAPRSRLDAGRVLGDDQSIGADPPGELRVHSRVVAVDPAAEDGDGYTTGVQRPTVRLTVHPASHAADHDQARGCELTPKGARDVQAVRRARPGSNDRDGGAVEKLRAAAAARALCGGVLAPRPTEAHSSSLDRVQPAIDPAVASPGKTTAL